MTEKVNYEVHEVYCDLIDFNLLIIEILREDLEDKLTFFAKDEGMVARVLFEDFLIASCVANINQILHKINDDILATTLDFLALRNKILEAILLKNPDLVYSNIVINKNHILKLKSLHENLEEVTELVDNPLWDYIPDASVTTNKELVDSFVDSEGNALDKTKEGALYTTKDKWWKRIGRYVSVKVFKEEDLSKLLNGRFFHSSVSFNTFVVTLCIEDFESLFQLLENMGIPARVSPPLLMKELYDLCQLCNPFLTYENAQELVNKDKKSTECTECGTGSNKRTMSSGATSMEQFANKVDKKKKVFADVPEEDLLNLATNMKVSLIGQDKVVNSLTDAIQRASVGLKDPVKPIGSFLFAGSTGCGKSLTGKILANELIKDRDNLITIDCSEYSADHEYSKLIGCFVPGTKVLRGDGSVTNIEEMQVGDEVISHKGKKRKVEHVHTYNQKGHMVKFSTTLSNIPVVTTKTHEIYAIKGQACAYTNRKHVICKPSCSKQDCSFKLFNKYSPKWIAASELEVGDIVMYPRLKTSGNYLNRLDLKDYLYTTKRYKWDDTHIWAQDNIKVPRFIEIDEDLARLAGYFVSEGGVGKLHKTFNFTFNSKEHSYIIEVVKLVRKLFGNDIRIKVNDRTLENNTFRIVVSSKVVSNLLASLFGENTYVKKLPVWFNELPEKILSSFLQTAVFGDGCTVIKRRMDYSTVSPNLFYQMEQLFRKLGYITYKQLEPCKKATNNLTDRYRLYISGNQINELEKEFNFGIDMGGMKNTHIQRLSWMDENYQYVQIKKIEQLFYCGKVYDLAVEKDTSYVTEIAVHNSPNGYQGYENGGLLTNAIIENPFSVVVFDEIEKASSKIYQLLLQVLEEGRLTDNKGTKVSFKDTVIILTSNIGVENIANIGKTIGFGDVNVVTEDKKEKAIEKALKQKFKPEFLNRLDEVIYFNDLTKEDYFRIIDIELFKLNTNLQSNKTKYKDVELFFDKKVCEFIYDKGITKEYGARPLKRAIEKYISTPLAVQLLKGVTDTNTIVTVSTVNNEVVFKFSKKPSKIPAYLEASPEKDLLEASENTNV